VIHMAKTHFTYLADCRGKYEITLGDARLSLESEPKQEKFNVIVVDAFSGDSIPVHLLTREAFDIYRDHLAANGVIAVHVSNRYLRLAPVVRRLAENCGMQASRIDDEECKSSHLQSGSVWVLVTNNRGLLKANPSDPPDWGDDAFQASLWTDQYSNLFQILAAPW
jgi:spermidine synthase